MEGGQTTQFYPVASQLDSSWNSNPFPWVALLPGPVPAPAPLPSRATDAEGAHSTHRNSSHPVLEPFFQSQPFPYRSHLACCQAGVPAISLSLLSSVCPPGLTSSCSEQSTNEPAIRKRCSLIEKPVVNWCLFPLVQTSKLIDDAVSASPKQEEGLEEGAFPLPGSGSSVTGVAPRGPLLCTF